jgi:hypothetical protein
MEFDKDALLLHLNRIYCDEEVNEAVFETDLSVTAITPDQAFFVSTPPFVEEDGFQERVGLINLNLLINAIKLCPDEQIDLALQEDANGSQRLMVTDEAEGYIIISDPDIIGTRVKEADREAVLNALPDEGVPIPDRTAKQLLARQDLLGAMELTFNVSPDGTVIEVGPNTGNYWKVEYPGLRDDEEYELILQANALVAALEQIDDYSEAEVVLTGPDSVVGIRYDGYTYVLSPTG